MPRSQTAETSGLQKIKSLNSQFLLYFLWIAGSAAVLFFKSVYGSFLPYTWPDEALFSSPAASLASHGTFATTVLSGLIPGMETATLWNSPLYMILVSAVYAITGESQTAARTLSYIIAVSAYFVYLKIIFALSEGGSDSRTLIASRTAAALVPVFDLTFIRSANTVRMDVLALFFFLLTLLFIYKKIYPPCCIRLTQAKAGLLTFSSGLAAGCAGISHPFAVILVPVWAVYFLYASLFRPEETDSGFKLNLLPAAKRFFSGILIFTAGILVPFSAWIVYIFKYPEYFYVQFLSQLSRKSSMATFFGGETGGIFVVFSSQYGGGKLLMAGALAAFALSAAVLLNYFYHSALTYLNRRSRNPGFSVLPVFAVTAWAVFFIFLLYSSEGWYALYAAPFTVITLLAVRRHISGSESGLIQRIPVIGILLIFFIFSNGMFAYRHLVISDTPGAVQERMNDIIKSARQCRMIYLRVRPDPYFELRKSSPDTVILEFIPGKLRIPLSDSERLTETYSKVDCFLLDENHSWEEHLTRYLEHNKDDFAAETLPDRPPLDRVILFRRKAD